MLKHVNEKYAQGHRMGPNLCHIYKIRRKPAKNFQENRVNIVDWI